MPRMRMMKIGVVFAALFIGAGTIGAHVARPVAAQAPAIGARNTAAAQTAIVGVTAIAATDAPPTATAPSTPPPPPALTPTSGLQPTPTGSPIPNPAVAATIRASSGSVVALGTPVAASPTTGTGGSSPWPVVGVLVIVAAIGAASIVGVRMARGRSLRR